MKRLSYSDAELVFVVLFTIGCCTLVAGAIVTTLWFVHG
jgi:hypothetical protein